jgi:oligoendopeptidase F
MNAPFKTPDIDAPRWDLSDLYSGRSDPRIDLDLAQAKQHALLKANGFDVNVSIE